MAIPGFDFEEKRADEFIGFACCCLTVMTHDGAGVQADAGVALHPCLRFVFAKSAASKRSVAIIRWHAATGL